MSPKKEMGAALPPLQKNQELILRITDLNNLGCGVGRTESGQVVFVKGAVTGDTVRAKIIKVAKHYAVGRLEEVLTASPDRSEETFCSAPMSCGGCVYRNLTYERELEVKRGYVKNAFAKAGLPEVTVLPVRTADRVTHYRNKGQYPVAGTKDGLRAGFFATGTHRVIPCEDCLIQNESFYDMVRFVTEFGTAHGWTAYDEESGKGLLRHIYLRVGEKTGEYMLCLVINGKRLPNEADFVTAVTTLFPQIVSLQINENTKQTNVILGDRYRLLYGSETITDQLCGLRFRLAPAAFYQVNRDAAELLYTLGAEAAGLSGKEVLMDLYCGTGTIGLSMAKKAKKLVGVEIVPSAVACARENARENGIENAEFFCADAGDREVILKAAGGVRPDVVVIDPPRKGSTRELVECLAQLEVPKIVYISCDPDTLARDAVWFRERGYDIGPVTPVDLFPRTGHVESVVCLTRRVDR